MHKTWIQSQLYHKRGWCLQKKKQTRIIEIRCVGTHLRDHVTKYHRFLSLIFYHLYDLRILIPLLFLTHRGKKGGGRFSNAASQTITKGNVNSSNPPQSSLTSQQVEKIMAPLIWHSSLAPSQLPEGCRHGHSQAPGHNPLPGSPWYNSLHLSSLSASLVSSPLKPLVKAERGQRKHFLCGLHDPRKGTPSHGWVPYRQSGHFNCLGVEGNHGFI